MVQFTKADWDRGNTKNEIRINRRKIMDKYYPNYDGKQKQQARDWSYKTATTRLPSPGKRKRRVVKKPTQGYPLDTWRKFSKYQQQSMYGGQKNTTKMWNSFTKTEQTLFTKWSKQATAINKQLWNEMVKGSSGIQAKKQIPWSDAKSFHSGYMAVYRNNIIATNNPRLLSLEKQQKIINGKKKNIYIGDAMKGLDIDPIAYQPDYENTS